MKFNLGETENKFSNPKEEVAYLRERIEKIEKQFEGKEKKKNIEHRSEDDARVATILDQYADKTPEEVYQKGTVVPERVRDEIVLDLAPESHDQKMAELISLVYQKGISNVLDIVKKMNDPHIADDFHRFLVAYIRENYEIKGIKEGGPLYKDLNRTLFEVVIPEKIDKSEEVSLSELVAKMESFLVGMTSLFNKSSGGKGDYLSLEIANPVGSKEFVFYISVPNAYVDLFEKQLLSVFPDASATKENNDFNVFVDSGIASGAYLIQRKMHAEPLKTKEDFETDPLDVLLNVFTKIDEHRGGAAVQLIFNPIGDFYNSKLNKGIRSMENGKETMPEEFLVKNSTSSKLIRGLSGGLVKATRAVGKSGDGKDEPLSIDSSMLERVKKKNDSAIVSSNIRIVTSASNPLEAENIMRDIQSAFNQFNSTTGNSFELIKIKPKAMPDFVSDFSYRHFSQSYDIPLNLEEVAVMFHLPSETKTRNPQLKKNKSTTAPAPITLSGQGILLGMNNHAGSETEIHMSAEDRLRHFYVIGQTGTGKTNFLKSMIAQDIENGDGVCFIDPHGNDVEDILAMIPKERYDDVIYFDPAYTERPMGLNMLEYDRNFPEQKTFVVNELFSIFQKLYGQVPESMGPMFEQYFRNATLLVIEDPDSGYTLLDVSRVLADKNYRDLKLSRCKNPVVKQFWQEVAGKAGGEASLANIVPYITSKFDVFLANDIMRPVIAQEQSSFNFRKIMDEKKILLVNLSKGRLGDINSHLIGLIIVGKILMASLSRTDTPQSELNPFYLYIDEFQNVTTDSISTILSEARKYKLSLNIAHQFIGQLDEKIKDSVFGNVGSMAVFRVGNDDAEYLESQFLPTFSASDIRNIDNYNAYLKLLSNGIPQKPFNIKSMPAPEGRKGIIGDLKELSYLKFGRHRTEVEDEIIQKYNKEEL